MCQPGRPWPHGDSQPVRRLGGLPQREVQGVFLQLGRVDARAAFQVVHLAVRKLAVVSLLPDAVVDVPTRGVGEPAIDEPLGDLDDARDLIGGPRIDRGGPRVQAPQAGQVLLAELVRQRLHRRAQRLGAVDELVVDVGEVRDVTHAVAAIVEVANERIKDDSRDCVADVAIGIGRDAAHVELHLVRWRWQFDVLARKGIAKADGHGVTSIGSAGSRVRGHLSRANTDR